MGRPKGSRKTNADSRRNIKQSRDKPLRQRRIPFKPTPSASDTVDLLRDMHGSPSATPRTRRSSSNVQVVVTSPRNFRRESYFSSPVRFPSLNPHPSAAHAVPECEDTPEPLPLEIPPRPINSSPPEPQTPVRDREKSTHQSHINEFSTPTTSILSKSRRRRVESESDSDTVDHVQPEEKPQFEASAEEEDDSDEDSDVVGPRTRRQRYLPSSSPARALPRTPSAVRESDDELSEELRDITSSARKTSVSNRMRDARSRNKQKSQFQKNLESLKKKKHGLEDDSEEGQEEGKGLYDSASDVESIASGDFVVDDEEGLTLEEQAAIPPEFTSVAYQGMAQKFKVVIQAEVYALLHPDYHGLDYLSNPIGVRVDILGAAEEVDPYFRQAFKSLDRQITGITDSAVLSNAWKPWFVKALKERPHFESEPIRGELGDCDACNVAKRLLPGSIVTHDRHATWLARLSGPKYDHNTLEVIRCWPAFD
jgi:Domain of unknown function (DUF4211)